MNRVFVLVNAAVLALGLLTPTTAAAAQAASQGQTEARAKVVNLNTATAAELETLPGVGAATAARIIEYREKNGAFKKIEDLMNVRGIGEKTFLQLKSLITVSPPKLSAR